jgi:lysine-specific histone demethylase 1
MNDVDKRILDFHLANLEYANGAPINSVALKDWNLDDPYGFAGSHVTGTFFSNNFNRFNRHFKFKLKIILVKEGLGSIIERLSVDLDVKLNCIVNEIKYTEQGVSISYSYNTKQESGPSTSRMQNNNGSQKEVLKIQVKIIPFVI